MDNPFVKKQTQTFDKNVQSKPAPFGNTFVPKVNRPDSAQVSARNTANADKKDEKPADSAPGEKKLNAFEMMQQKRKEEEAKKQQERNNRPAI